MRRVAGHYPQSEKNTLSRAQTMRKQQRGPAGPRAPRPEEENPRVKCRDCGAFGHTARSTRCPMKRWGGALAPQPLGPNRGKENLAPRKPHDLQDPVSLDQSEREKEQRPRQEQQQRKSVLQAFPRTPQGRPQQDCKEVPQPCAYLRIPSRPVPVYTTNDRPALDPPLRSQPPARDDMSSTFSSLSPMAMQRLSSFCSSGPDRGQAGLLTETPKPAFKRYGQDPLAIDRLAPSRGDRSFLGAPHAASTTPVLGDVLKPQAGHKRPVLISQPCPPPATRSSGQDFNLSIRAPGKRPAETPTQTCQRPPKKPRRNPLETPQKSTQRPKLSPVRADLPPPREAGLECKVAPQWTGKSASQVPSSDLQPPHGRSLLSPVQACTEPRLPSPSPAPGQPLRMAFRRLDSGQWSSRLLPAPSCLLPEKPGPPAQNPHAPEKSEAHCARVPPSVLYEDLRLSSSSEDSDSE
nr:protein FAM90A1 [Microcebus murinus]